MRQDTTTALDGQRTRHPRAGSSGGAPATTTLRPAGGAAAGASPGRLVTCAKKDRVSKTPGQYTFPDRDEVRAAAATVGPFVWDGGEGPRPALEVAPGLVRLTAPDLNRREKSHERALRRRQRAAIDEAHAEKPGSAEESSLGSTGRRITGWSRRSRARMVATMAELDLAPLLMSLQQPAMVTLTYPGDWVAVAPDGPTVKRHLKAFFQRYERAWSEKWRGVWKLEFQRRGAPHFHLLMAPPDGRAGDGRRARFEADRLAWESAGRRGAPPRWKESIGDGMTFRAWLSVTWADIVAADDEEERSRHILAGTGVDYAEGDRARDPKRAAVYFGKHGSFAAKDYQHEVPEEWRESKKTVGRFWGYRGLSKVKGAASLDFDTMIFLGRVLRRYGCRTRVWDAEERKYHFRPVLRTTYRPRGPRLGFIVGPDGEVVERRRLRRQTERARRMTGPHGAGFLLVNDGPGVARVLARAIEACLGEGGAAPVGLRGSVRERQASSSSVGSLASQSCSASA